MFRPDMLTAGNMPQSNAVKLPPSLRKTSVLTALVPVSGSPTLPPRTMSLRPWLNKSPTATLA